jgi:hypothetical protein
MMLNSSRDLVAVPELSPSSYKMRSMMMMMSSRYLAMIVVAVLATAPGCASAFAPINPAKAVVLFGTTLSTPQQQQPYGVVSPVFPLKASEESIQEVTSSQQVEPDFFPPATEPLSLIGKAKSRIFSLEQSTLEMAATMIAATSLTFLLTNASSLGPIRASSVIAMLATMVLPENLALVALCGSFAGMAKTAVIPGFAASLLLGGTSAAMMAQFNRKKWLVGVGGRLGFIAQCACTLQFILTALFVAPPPEVGILGAYPSLGKLLKPLPSVTVCTIAGAFFMTFWKKLLGKRAKNATNSEFQADLYKRLSNSVGAVGATGLVAALVLPASAAGPAFCGSFIAMSAPTKLPTYGALLGASIMAGLCQQSLAGVLLGGWGGKLGTAALMGVLSYRGLANVAERIIKENEVRITASVVETAVNPLVEQVGN